MRGDYITKELIQLIKENPDLPVVSMVSGNIVADDSYAYWLGSFARCDIDEYMIDDWYGDGCVRFKSDDEEDTIIEGIAEYKYGDCTDDDNWKRAKEFLKTLWKKAIIVYIEAPNEY